MQISLLSILSGVNSIMIPKLRFFCAENCVWFFSLARISGLHRCVGQVFLHTLVFVLPSTMRVERTQAFGPLCAFCLHNPLTLEHCGDQTARKRISRSFAQPPPNTHAHSGPTMLMSNEERSGESSRRFVSFFCSGNVAEEYSSSEDEETPQEKRLRMTKEFLESLKNKGQWHRRLHWCTRVR